MPTNSSNDAALNLLKTMIANGDGPETFRFVDDAGNQFEVAVSTAPPPIHMVGISLGPVASNKRCPHCGGILP